MIQNLIKPMPKMELASPADFEKTARLHQETPYNDRYLTYKIHIPQDWEKAGGKGNVGYSLNNIVFGEVSRFYSPPRGDLRSHVSIQAMEMKYNLTAEQWMVQYVLSQGLALQGFTVIDERRTEALYVVNEKDVSYIVRSVVVLNGRRAMMASYFMPADGWDTEKTVQAQVVRSFVLTEKNEEFVEDMQEYKFLDISSFHYPKSWELRSKPIRTVDRMSAEIYNISIDDAPGKKAPRTLNGKIGLTLVSSFGVENLESEVARFKKELADTGLYLEDPLESPDLDYAPGIDFAQTTVYRATDTRDALLDYEFWLTIMSAHDYYYFVALLTPDRDEDYATWSRNVQAYKLVMTQIKFDTMEQR